MTNSKININVPSGIFNGVYLPFLDNNTRTQIFFGGSSAGKSVFLSDRAILDLLNGGRNYLGTRNTGVTLRTSMFNELKKSINKFKVDSLFTINKSEMTITCVNGYQAILKGLDDVEKIKSMVPQKGVITDIWVEEATETQEMDVKQLERRLRGLSKYPKRLIFSFNPIMKTHWLFKKYFANWIDASTQYRDEQMSILKTTYKDNRFLVEDDRNFLENEQDEYWYNVYTLGNWGVLGEAIFKNWTVEDIDPALKETFDNYKNGLDFGYCVDEQTEILTKKGWRKENELVAGDIALTLNPETELSEWQEIDEVNRFNGVFDMRLIERQGHNSFTTANHRWFVKSQSGKGSRGRPPKKYFRETQDLKKSDVILCASKCSNLPTQSVYSNSFVELVAWFWTEGQIDAGGISIWQNEGEYAERIRGCLFEEFGGQLVKTRNGRNRAKAGWVERPKRRVVQCHFAINLNGAKRFIDVAPGKLVSPDFISFLTFEQLQLFIDVSIMADGWLSKYKTKRILQIKKERLDIFQMACSLAGIRTNLTFSKGKRFYDKKEYDRWNMSLYGGHDTVFGRKDHSYIGQAKQKKIRYQGMVWCPVTKNKTWFARRDGTVFFTGNSSDPVAMNKTHYHRDRKTIYILKELHEYGLTNPALAELLKPIVGNERVICDSAEPKSIQELKNCGVNAIGAKKGKDSVNFGIQWLQQQKIIIDRQCQHTVNEFVTYQWKKNRYGEVMREPTKKDDHHIDNLRYQYENEMPGRNQVGVW